MKQKKYSLWFRIMLVFWLVAVNFVAVGAADAQNANRMNVVFVMDESGSMVGTDGEGFRYDAMDLFMGLAADSGNYMGAVVFDTNIILQEDIVQIDGAAAKYALSQRIRSVSSYGDTDIGKAMEAATQMIQTQGNPNLPSVIILLSDGNTDLNSNSAYQASAASKRNAIDIARQNGYKVYSVCLNVDGTADPAELREISEATGGNSEEVKSVEDLKKVFSQFYKIIYPTETVVIGDVVIPGSGEVEIPFSIPRIGVEEANIIINTLNPNTSYRLTQPNGIAFTSEELDAMRISAKTFSVFKIQNPEHGQWKLVVRGIPGDNVKIEMVYNVNLAVQTEVNNGKLNCSAEEDILITAQLFDYGTAVLDDTIYQEYPLHLVLHDTTSGVSYEEEMEIENHCGKYIFHVPQDAEYDISAYCMIDNMTVTSQTYHLSATNSIPWWDQNPIVMKKILVPFVSVEDAIDLSKNSFDNEDAVLTYQIRQSDLETSAVSIDGKNLTIHYKEVGKGGEFYVAAIDSQGASAEVLVRIQVVSLLPVLLTILAILIGMIVGIIMIQKEKKNRQPICGRIMITPYTEDETLTSKTTEGAKGRMYLGDCLQIRENIGMDWKNSYFIAGEEKRFIYLISKEGYYTDAIFDSDVKSQKIHLEENIPTRISSENDLRNGIEVTYISDGL